MAPGTDPSAARSRAGFLLCMFVFGTVGLFVRQIGLSSVRIALLRAVIALAVLGLAMFFTGKLRSLVSTGFSLWRFLLSGALMAGNWILLFEAYASASIALATLSYYAAPSFVLVFSLVLFREKAGKRQLLLFALGSLGLALVLGTGGAAEGELRGVLLGLAAAALYAAVILINKSAGNIDGLTRSFVQFAAATAVLLPFVFLSSGLPSDALSTKGLVFLLILGTVHTGLCYWLYFHSIARMKGQQVALLSYLDPLVAVLLSTLLLGEAISPWQLFGGLLMLLSAMLNEVSNSRILQR